MQKINKILNIVTIVMFVITVVLLGLFYFGGELPNSQYATPVYTEQLLWWSYLLFGIAIVAALIFPIARLFTRPKEAMKSFIALAGIIVLVLIAYSMSDGTIMNIPGYSGSDNVPGTLKFTDTILITTYFLGIGAILKNKKEIMARKKTPEINASSTADIAFLLLTFFLMTTTMDVDSGLFRRLPPMPPPDQVIAPPVAKRNILQVLVNKNDLLAVNGELMQIENLKEKAKEFILNPQNREDLPSKVVKEIPFFGQAEVSRGIISLQSDRGTSYKMYIAVQDELTAAYNEIRDIKAMEKWGKKYSELTEEQMDAVRKLVPTAISEAEPKNIGKGGKK